MKEERARGGGAAEERPTVESLRFVWWLAVIAGSQSPLHWRQLQRLAANQHKQTVADRSFIGATWVVKRGKGQLWTDQRTRIDPTGSKWSRSDPTFDDFHLLLPRGCLLLFVFVQRLFDFSGPFSCLASMVSSVVCPCVQQVSSGDCTWLAQSQNRWLIDRRAADDDDKEEGTTATAIDRSTRTTNRQSFVSKLTSQFDISASAAFPFL